jgi:hypothetical protein
MALVSTSDFNTRFDLSYGRHGIDMNDHESYRWVGYVDVNAGGSYANLDLITPSRQKGKTDHPSLIIPAGSYIRHLAFKPLGNLTIGSATGKLKMATSLASVTAGLVVESAAASGGVLTAPTDEYATKNISSVLVGSSDVTFKLFATDGTTGASTVSTPDSKRTRILFMVSFIKFCRFPTEVEISALDNYKTD